MITDFRQQLNELKNAADKEEYAKQLANIFLTGNLDLKTILLMAMDYGAQSRWISVEDELPTVRIRVLAYNWVMNRIAWVLEDGRWVAETSQGLNERCFMNYPVTHWMPLPAPPVVSKTENTILKGGEV